MDLPSPTEPVASKKNLFEAGEAWSQTPRETPSKVGKDDIRTAIVFEQGAGYPNVFS